MNQSDAKQLQVTLPEQQGSVDVFIEKYSKNGETTHDQVFMRVAAGLAKVEATDELVQK